MGLLDRFRRRDRSGDRAARAVAEQAFERGKRAYFDQEDFRLAAAEFGQAVELTPESVDSQCLLGASLVKLGDNAGAIGPLRRCLALAPDHDVANYLLGMALGRLDQFDESETYLAKAASLGNAPAGDMLARLGRDYCRRCTRAVHRSAPVDADVVVSSPPFGLTCPGCGTVICWGCCIPKGETSHIVVRLPPCPRCRTAMVPFETPAT